MGLYQLMFYVYELTVGGEPYYGFTSRHPRIRLEEHLKTAETGKWKHKSKLYPVLHEMELEHTFKILKETDSELEALLFEIAAIRSAGKSNTLNLSDGGEGSTITLKTREVNGAMQVMVVPRKKPRKGKRKKYNRRRYKR